MAIHPSTIPPNDLTGLSLCAGVGGLELGLHIAEPGYRTVCYVERDAFAAATLVARMADKALADAPIWSDLRTFDGRPWRGRLHILTAGYPCQPFSFAGRRLGDADPRHLWPEVARVAREVGPDWIFCENVDGHLSMGLAEVLGELSAMGYAAKAGLFSAAEVGASHLRRRVFILAHAGGYSQGMEPLGHRDQREGAALQASNRPDRQTGVAPASGAVVGDALCDDEAARRETDRLDDLPLFAPLPFDFAGWNAVLDRRLDLQPELFGLDDGLANRMERAHAVGNGVVPLAAAYAWRTLRAAFASG